MQPFHGNAAIALKVVKDDDNDDIDSKAGNSVVNDCGDIN